MNKVNRIGVDLGKNKIHLCAVDKKGRVLKKLVVQRERFLATVFELAEPGTAIGMEACGGAHHWSRELLARGYEPKLIAPQFVKPYIRGNKTDHADAQGIAEAMDRPGMRFVAIKSAAQQEVQAVHRVRSEWIERRTASVNQIRGLATEFGLVAPKSIAKLRLALSQWLDEEDSVLSVRMKQLLLELREDLAKAHERVKEMDHHLERQVEEKPSTKRLIKMRGVGPVIATAMHGKLGDDAKAYDNGRAFAASLGLVPRQFSTGGVENLLGISKRGDGYLRKQLIHGARSMVINSHRYDDALSRWIQRLKQRKHINVVIVAVAAKMARIAWALVRYARDYDPNCCCADLAAA